MNIEIERLELRGRVLDVGGGARASYYPLLHTEQPIISVNIAREMAPTVIADLADALPFADRSFDTLISFNTLEHLADDAFALSEMIRVLEPGGRLHILVPFLLGVHGDPSDYHRHTAHGWNHLLRSAGIANRNQSIRPLVWDPFATAWSIADGAPLGRNWWRLRRVVRRIVLRRPLVMRAIDRRIAVAEEATIVANYAIAYAIDVVKPSE